MPHPSPGQKLTSSELRQLKCEKAMLDEFLAMRRVMGVLKIALALVVGEDVEARTVAVARLYEALRDYDNMGRVR